MKLSAPGSPHLTYCTNVHPGEALEQVLQNLSTHVRNVRDRISPDRPFGVGLWLAAKSAVQLEQGDALRQMRAMLDENGLYVFTLNGFPFGAFHGERVKTAVYRPDWSERARLEHTDRLARVLAALLPDDVPGTISTVPIAQRTRANDAGFLDAVETQLVEHVARLHRLRDETGKTISLALEPEPCCLLETAAEAVRFFETHVFSQRATQRLRTLVGASAEEIARRHIGVCLDTCHMAVEYETPNGAVDAFRNAGIGIAKIQLSTGLRVGFNGAHDAERVEALKAYAEDVYLHQVVESRPGSGALRRFLDLPEALASLDATDREPREWMIHFHVPIHRARFGPFENTQDFLQAIVARAGRESISPHLEVETYTWSVLPEAERCATVEDEVVRELQWVLGAMQ